jgi:hypothetical protein
MPLRIGIDSGGGVGFGAGADVERHNGRQNGFAFGRPLRKKMPGMPGE